MRPLATSISTRDAAGAVVFAVIVVAFVVFVVVELGFVVTVVLGVVDFVVNFVVGLLVVVVVGAVVLVRGSIEQSDMVRLSNASFEPPFV